MFPNPLLQVSKDSVPQIWVTTASEGLTDVLGIKQETDDVGAVFMCSADPDVTGLTADSSAWESCHYSLQLD